MPDKEQAEPEARKNRGSASTPDSKAQTLFFEHPLVKPRTVEARPYQLGIAQRAMQGGNSLVVAPTALGKTIVAVIVAAQVLEKTPESKVLFLAPTKPLCQQHQLSMQKFLAIPEEQIILLTGSVSSKKRAAQWEQARIIAATPQTIGNDLRNGKISLENVSLLIFDEAHRAVGDYAYVYIAKKYVQKNPRAFILGLTASPGGREEHIKEVCSNLFTKNIEIKSLRDADVQQFAHEIKVEWRVVELPEKFREIKLMLERFMQKQIDILYKFGLSRSKTFGSFNKKRLLEMQQQVSMRIKRSHGTQPSLFAAATAIAALLKASHAHLLLETQGISPLHDYFERTLEKAGKSDSSRALKQMLASEEIKRAIALTRELREKGEKHPKLAVLVDTLRQQFELFPESRAIVFNHYRDSIRQIAEELGRIPGIRAERFVGQATKGKDAGMSQKEQAEKIVALRSGEINTIVASSVAEEGLDIPLVDLVVFYEPVPSEIRFIQRRGRTGRFKAGRAVILMAKGTRDEAFYWSSVRKEKKMHSTLRRMQNKGLFGQAELGKKEKIADGSEEAKSSDLGSAREAKESGGAEAPEAEREKGIEEAEEEAGGSGESGGQTTLFSFAKTENLERIVVYADAREESSTVLELLREMGCEVIVRQLGVGDYIPGKDIAVERKTVQDFLSSIVDGRLGQQLVNMAESYERPLVLLEGSLDDLFNSRNIHRNAIVGMLTSIALNYRVPVLFTASPRESAQFIYVIAKREQLGKGTDVRLRLGRKGLTIAEQQRFIVESLPMVGPQTARSLLLHFGSVKALVGAGEKELQEVDKLGKKKAKAIKSVFESKYVEG
ncbi:MAG: DEAD/DEAH box helicase [Candidatus Diapherotrites archaeon]|nr:DEAD/DEAH box helicase [Candidatus Diapherotrites archaeon]